MPKASAWIIAPTNDRSSGTSVRSASARIACTRPVPICISCRTRKNSCASGPVVRRATCARPASNARPDSTEIVSRSSASGSSRRTCCDRSYPTWYSQSEGATQPPKHPMSTSPKVTSGLKPSRGGTTSPSRKPTSAASALSPRMRSASQPVGLPARSRRRRMRRMRSSGVNLRPMAVNLAASGSSTRSVKGRSRSCSRMSRRGRLMASTAASDLATPLRGAPGVSRPVATMSSTNAAKNSSRPTRRSGLTSHLHLDDAGQPERADAEQDEGKDDQPDAERGAPHRGKVCRIRHGEVDEEEDGQRAEDPPRQPALGRQHPHLPAEPLTLAECLRDHEEQLREVAADVALDPDGHHHPGEVLARHPPADPLEGVLDGHPEPALDECAIELGGHGGLPLPHHRVDRLGQRVARLHAAGEHLDGVRQLGEEGALA